MTTELMSMICKAKEDALKTRLLDQRVGAVRFVMGLDFQQEEISFLQRVYFPYLMDRGSCVASGGPNDCDCDAGLCSHMKTGYYVVALVPDPKR